MIEASLLHVAAGKLFEEKGQLDAALREFHRASEYDPSNRELAAHVNELDHRLMAQIEAGRPKPAIDSMRERARGMHPEPTLNPASREPLDLHFTGSVRDLLKFISGAAGINITFTSDYRDPPQISLDLTGVTLEQALQQVLSVNGFFYKVLNERTILVIPDTAQNHSKYEEMVVRTFYLSHADAQDVVQLAERGHARPWRAARAGVLREQDPELDHRPRLGAAGHDHGAAHRAERSPARRDPDGRADSRGEPAAREAVRAGPDAVLDHGHLLARTFARPGDGGRHFERAVQHEHALARHQRGGFLPVRSGGHRQFPGDGYPDEIGREASAAWPGGRKDHAEPRQRDSRGDDHIRIRRRRGQHRDDAGVVLQLQTDRHQHRGHAARDLRRRHRAGAHHREQLAGPRRQHRGPELSVVRVAQGDHPDPAARRRVHAAGGPAPGRRPAQLQGVSRADSRARHPEPLHVERHLQYADRHRHPDDAAHRPRPRVDPAGHRSGVHRVAAEPRPERSAASHRCARGDARAIRSGSGAAAEWHDADADAEPDVAAARHPACAAGARLHLRPRRRKGCSRPRRRSSQNQRPSRRPLQPTSRRRSAASSSP